MVIWCVQQYRSDLRAVMSLSKECTKCKQTKLLEEFPTFQQTNATGVATYVRSWCKACRREYERAYRAANREKVNRQAREAYARRKQGISRPPRQTHAERQANQNAYERNRRKTDEAYRIMKNLRRRLHLALKRKGAKKAGSMRKLTGASWKHVQRHLESLFLPGMTWENQGFGKNKWHIDHIMPFAYFDIRLPEEQRRCCHWTNLQPLWQKDNLKKKDRITRKRRWVDAAEAAATGTIEGWVDAN